MHCANLDALVKVTMNPLHESSAHGASSSPSPSLPPPSPKQLTQNVETKEEEGVRMLRMILDAGILILEGRLPDRTSKRGYVEGPHCVLCPQKQRTHLCDFNSYLCQRAKKYRQLIQSLWTEYGGVCIELRMCADCVCGQEHARKNTFSRHDHVLEQWRFEITDHRNGDEDIGIMNSYGLLQAIRSQIHFSQLSAWWCSNRAQLPKNLSYRVVPLKQSDANSCPLQHNFPVLAFSTSYLQVKVRSQPRSEVLPKVHCPLHCNQDKVVDDRMKICCNRLGKHHCQAIEDFDENDNERWYADKNTFMEGVYEPQPMVVPISLPRTPIDDDFIVIDGAFESLKMSVPRTTLNVKIPTFRSRPSSGNRVCPTKMSSFSHCSKNGMTSSPPTTATTSVWPPLIPDETNGQFVNVCNWTNSMMSNVMSRMRTTNAFFNLSDTSSLYAYLHNKLDLLDNRHRSGDGGSSTSCSSSNSSTSIGNSGSEWNRLKHSPAERSPICTRRNRTRCDQQPCEQKSEVVTNVTTNLGSGDMKVQIARFTTDSFNEFSVADDICRGAEMNGDERKPWKGQQPPACGPNTSAVVLDKSFLKSRQFHEKCLRFENSKKRLLPFVGNVIESVLSGRVCFSRTIQNFKIKVNVGGSSTTQNNLTDLPAATYYYHFGDGIMSRSYLVKGFILDNEKGLQIPASGRLQVSVYNTEDALIKVFVISYDLSDMSRCSKTYLRHSNYYLPDGLPEYSLKWLQSFLRMKCSCSKSGRLYLQNEIDVIIFQKSDLNTACEFEMKSDLKHHDVTEIEYKNEPTKIVNNA